VEEEGKNALEMGKEKKKENKESAKEKSRRTLVQLGRSGLLVST
jgi:hypothetical protein